MPVFIKFVVYIHRLLKTMTVLASYILFIYIFSFVLGSIKMCFSLISLNVKFLKLQ